VRYFEVLVEGRSQAVSQEQAFEILRTKCSSALTATPIFRGVGKSSEHHMWVEPQNFSRKSANTQNYHTLLVDNMASWSAFPKRSQSIICTTDMMKAARYGGLGGQGVYRVLPINGSTIGVCSDDDWWDSFSQFERFGVNVASFNDDLEEVFIAFFNDVPASGPANWKIFEDWITKVDEQIQKAKRVKRSSGSDWADDFRGAPGYLIDNDGMSFTDTLRTLLEPIANGFKMANINNFQTQNKVEVWTDGPSLLIANSVYDDFIAAYLDGIEI